MKKPKPSARRMQARRQRDRARRAARTRAICPPPTPSVGVTVERVVRVVHLQCGKHAALYGDTGRLLAVVQADYILPRRF